MARRKTKRRKPRLSRVQMNRMIKGFTGLLPYVFSLLFLGGVVGGSYAFALQGDLFILQHVTIAGWDSKTPGERFAFAGLAPEQSLFSIDLKSVEDHIRRFHPEYRSVRVKRVLPNEIHISVRKRSPQAQVKINDRYYPIDTTGVVLPGIASRADKKYPMILGVPSPRSDISVGSQIRYRLLDQAMHLIRDLYSRQALQEHSLNAIDISDSKNFILLIDENIEIRMGSRNFSDKIRKLEETLTSMDINPDKIRYVDLRFDDIVIGPR